MSEKLFLEQIGKRIREIRQMKQLSQVELAKRCQFEKASMSRIESGRTNVSLLTLRKISVALQIEMAEIFEGVSAEIA